MTDTNVLKLVQPGTFSDLLTDVLRSGAHALLAPAVEVEVASFLAATRTLQTEDGRHGWRATATFRNAGLRLASVPGTCPPAYDPRSSAIFPNQP